MRRALITGITGQDGSYLAELLLANGYEVHGIIRRSSSLNTSRIDHIFDRLKLHHGDMGDGGSLRRTLDLAQPDEVYNLAAQSHVRVSFDEPEYTQDVTAGGTLRHRAKLAGAEAVTVWGSGQPRREVMHVADCARAALHFMQGPPVEGIVNVGTGIDHPIAGLAAEIAHVVGYEGRLVFDKSKPDGTPRKVLDVSRAKSLGWESRIGLREGLEMTYRSMHADP